MRYSFGANLKEYLFEQQTEELKQAIAERIMTKMALHLPFVTVQNLNVTLSDDDSSLDENSIKIKLRFSLNGRPDLASEVQTTIQ